MRFDDSVRVLILNSSAPGSFCAGADLVERRDMTKGQVSKFLADLRAALGKLEGLPMPTIAAIDGPALGGGLELALACDLRVAGMTSTRDDPVCRVPSLTWSRPWKGHSVTKIGLPETRLGIIPGAGGTQRATRILGLSKAKDLIFTGRMLTAPQAEELGTCLCLSLEERCLSPVFSGLVDYVSDKDTPAMDRALTLAGEIAANGTFPLLSRMTVINISFGHQSTSRLAIGKNGYFTGHGAFLRTR